MKKKKNYLEASQEPLFSITAETPIPWRLKVGKKTYHWKNQEERIHVVREGLPYESIECISHHMGSPIKNVLQLMGIPQTTYNKKKCDSAILDIRESEWIVEITELISYGMEVFNHEGDKFLRWLRKPNLGLSNHTPESLLDTFTGIAQVKMDLERLDYGVFV
jgi:putative toxin-antitoxin system antitoxin component (TIGR02293 family)